MLGLALAALAGVVTLHTLPRLPEPGWLALAIACALLAAKWWRLPGFRCLAAAIAGFVWCSWQSSAALSDRLAGEPAGLDLQIIGRIVSLPERDAVRTRFDFAPVQPAGLPGRVRLAWYGAPPLAGAERWRLRVRLRPPHGYANPGGYDYERALFAAGIGATGYVRDDPANRRLAPAPPLGLLHWRGVVAARLGAVVGDRAAGGLILGLAVGSRQGIGLAQWTVLRRTGTAHLMAISGLHIGLVAGLCYWLGSRLGRWARRQRSVAADLGRYAALTGALIYAAMAGLALPTQRALLMLAVWLVGLGLRRTLPPGRTLGLALAIVLLRDPLAPLSSGFWLSFVAVGCLLAAGAGRIGHGGRLSGLLRAQWAVTLGLAPVVLTAFGQLSLIGPLANLALIPLFSLAVVPLVLLGTLLLFVWPDAGAALIGAAARLLEAVWPGLEALAAARLATWTLSPDPAVLLALTLAAAMLIVPTVRSLRGLAVLLLLPLLLWRSERPAAGAFELILLDVGQGLAAVLRTHRHTLVYDAGPRFRSGGDTGRLVVQPFLEHRGWAADLLLISHDDIDHVGGASSLLAESRVGGVLAPSGVALADHRVQRCRRGLAWTWDGVRFEILHPPDTAGWRGNDGSCVLRVSSRGGSVLLPGDIEARGERALIAAGRLRSDVVVVPHHGSATSSTDAFIAATRPRIALFSTGYGNRWGFPRPEVVQRWRAVGAIGFDTARNGALQVLIEPDGDLLLSAYRRDSPRYWR